MNCHRAVVIATMILGPLLFPPRSDAASISVPIGGSVQAAIDAASPGDTVRLVPGLYFENIRMKERVALVGSGAGVTTIRALFRGCVVLANAGTKIRHLTIGDGEVGIYASYAGGFIVSDCSFMGNDTALVLVGRADFGNFCVERCVFAGNSTAIVVDSTQAEIRDCDIHGNRLAIMCGDSGSPLVTGCRISCNQVGLDAYEDSVPLLANCIFRGNGTAVRSGGHSNPQLVSCTLWLSTYALRTYQVYPTAITVSNSIIWGNDEAAVDLHFGPLGSVEITYSNVEAGWPGEGNLDADPQFVNPFSLNLRLQPGSPCIDAGDNAAPDLPETDIVGNHRIMFGGRRLTVDIGAYEYYINELHQGPTPHETTLTWSSLADRTYSIFYSEGLITWYLADEAVLSAGDTTTSWVDDGTLTGIAPSLAPRRFYRILENP